MNAAPAHVSDLKSDLMKNLASNIVDGRTLANRLDLARSGQPARLFHGTCEPALSGASANGPDGLLRPRPGTYDQVHWTAPSSAVAQSYIPAAGGKTLLCINRFELDNSVRPSRHSVATEIVRMMGHEAQDVSYDHTGLAKSYRFQKGYPTHRELVQFVEETLGYASQDDLGGDRRYWIKTGAWDAARQRPTVLAANFKMAGTLLVLEGFEGMRFLNISTGDPDLQNLQYHRLKTFAAAREAGLDGVVIDDFCQTDQWGNLGHTSVGFFDSALPQLRVARQPAVRFDFGPSASDLHVQDTPEYLEFLANGKFVDYEPQACSAALRPRGG